MATLNNFDANQVDPSVALDPLPAGKYLAVVSESELKPTKTGGGKYLQLTFQIIDGEFKGRLVWARLKLQQVEKRLDEFIGEARSIRAQYAEMERKIWFLEGKLSGLTSNSPRQSVPTTGSPVIGGGP